MLTHSEAKRWATLVLKVALRDDMKPDEISRQVHLVCDYHGRKYLKELIKKILTEAGRIGLKHSDGQLRPH